MKLPLPDGDALAYSEALKRRIADEIESGDGWIGFDRFMETEPVLARGVWQQANSIIPHN